MKELFPKDVYLPSLPSAWDCPNDEIMHARDQLLMKCAAALSVPQYDQEAARQTLTLLLWAGERIIRAGNSIPFVVSAAGLATEVQRCDCLGPARLRFHYEAQLQTECNFLVPRRITEADMLLFRRILTTWDQNRESFRCKAIGAVLALKLFHLQKRIGG